MMKTDIQTTLCADGI